MVLRRWIAKMRSFSCFLDCFGFITDYMVMSQAIDVLGYNTNAPFHLFLFHRYKMSASGSLTYGYSTEVVSFYPSFCIIGEKMEALLERGVSRNKLNRIGLSPESETTCANVGVLRKLN